MKAEGRQDLRKRTKEFSLRVIKLFTALPKTTEAQVLGKQILSSERQSARIIEKLVAQNLTRTSSARLKGDCKNSTKHFIGSSCLPTRGLFPLLDSNR